MSDWRKRVTYGEIATEVNRRTSIPYPIIKTIVLNFLHYEWFKLRLFKFSKFYYFRPVPDVDKLSKMTDLEIKRTFKYLYADANLKKKRNTRVHRSITIKKKNLKINSYERQ